MTGMTHSWRGTVAGLALVLVAANTSWSMTFTDDFTGGFNLPWLFIDDLGEIPPEFATVVSNDAEQNVQLLGNAEDYSNDSIFNTSTTGYVGLENNDYLFAGDVFVSATFSPLDNLTLGMDDEALGNNDVFVVLRGEGLTGYIFALDAWNAEADIVRVDEGVVVGLGDTAILRDIPGVTQDGTYTLRFSAVGDLLTGQLYDEDMNLLGEASVEESTYDSGWTGAGAAINDGGDDLQKTLIAAAFDNFTASDTPNIQIDPPTIDEITMAVINGVTDSRFDVNDDGAVDDGDRVAWVVELNNTYFGDANLDGEFSSADFVAVFVNGEYEDDVEGNSLWSEGDWDGDADFTSGDFVRAFIDGGYEIGPRAASAVPEPTWVSWLLAFLVPWRHLRRQPIAVSVRRPISSPRPRA